MDSRRRVSVAAQAGDSPASSSGSSDPQIAQVGDAQQSDSKQSDTLIKSKDSAVSKLVMKLRDFGFGRRSVWEGGVGIFILFGIGVFLLLTTWLRGSSWTRGRSYQTIIEFPESSGVAVGTPVRIRGCKVGSVLQVSPHLDRVDVLVEIGDQTSVIPRNAQILANQSGLVAEPMIDIMPMPPIPDYKNNPLALPLDPECKTEGLVVCHKERVRGERGVALDDLVYYMTRMAREMDNVGTDGLFSAMRNLKDSLGDAQPVVDSLSELLVQIGPLLSDIRKSNILPGVDSLVSTASDTAGEMQSLMGEVLGEPNKKALKQLVPTLINSLQHIETMLGRMAEGSGDAQLLERVERVVTALSRMKED